MLTSEALSSLFDRYRSELRFFIMRRFADDDLADDVVQEAFHKLLVSANSKGSAASHIDNPKAYLYQTVKNIALNNIRRAGHHQDYLSRIPAFDEETVCLHRENIAKQDLKRVQQRFISLSEKDRRTFILNRIHGKSYKEISQELNVSISTVEKRMIKVLQHLRDVVAE